MIQLIEPVVQLRRGRMARRKKAPDGFHKEQIAASAGRLFMEKGIKGTSMNDIVRESGYGKATVYSYFKNKDEIVSMLALDSMKKLLENIKEVMEKDETIEEQYFGICKKMVCFQKEFPQYFRASISKINVDLECSSEIEKETFIIGEQINLEVEKLLKRGIEKGEFRDDLLLPQTVFSFWGAISGIIDMSGNKELYIEKTMGIDRNQLLEYAFKLLFEALKKGAAI